MVSKNCPIIGKHLAVKFVAEWVIITTIRLAKNTLNSSFERLKLKNELGDPYFLVSKYDKHDKMQRFRKFKKILWSGFRAILNLRKYKVALNPLNRMFLNFLKSGILSCLS